MSDHTLMLLALHHKRVRKYVSCHVPFDDAEDVLQDIAIRALRCQCDDIREPMAYLYRMAHHCILDYRTRLDRERHIVFDSTLFEDTYERLTADDVTLQIEREQEVDAAMTAVKKVKQRHALLLHAALDYSIQEAAEEMGITYHYAEKCYARAMKVCRTESCDTETAGVT